jgi:hypothetical protein
MRCQGSAQNLYKTTAETVELLRLFVNSAEAVLRWQHWLNHEWQPYKELWQHVQTCRHQKVQAQLAQHHALQHAWGIQSHSWCVHAATRISLSCPLSTPIDNQSALANKTVMQPEAAAGLLCCDGVQMH